MGKYHQYYDKLNFRKKDYVAEIRLLKRRFMELSTLPLDKILEIGCGTGNHTTHLCDIAKVAACDIDADMIAIASQKLNGRVVEFFNHISNVKESGFPVCVMMWHIINYFSDVYMIDEIFYEVHKRLADDGLFMFDMWNGVAAIRDLPKTANNVIQIDGQTIKHTLIGSTALMEMKTSILNSVSVYEGDRLVCEFEEKIDHFIWTTKVVKDILTKTNFKEISIVNTSDYKTPATEKDWKVMVIAKK